jgi:hypothetical protein
MTVFTVTSNADSGTGTLRAALELANATPGTNTIDFAIGSGFKTIALQSPLPAITEPVIIDGTSQPGAAGRPGVELYGAAAPGDGLTVSAPATTIEGLVVDGFSGNQVVLRPGADGATIEGNYLGVDPTGSFARGGSGAGLLVLSNNNVIGGLPASARNVISGNGAEGVKIVGRNNWVVDNLIGTDSAASRPIGNGADGVRVEGSGNTIGGAVAGARNVISGNRLNGVELFGPGNLVAGNAIGVDSGGSRVLSNASNGVVVVSAAGNTIGGTVAPAANTISANQANGVVVYGGGSTGTLVVGNRIGTDVGGSGVLGNGGDGLLVTAGASDTKVGGIDPSMRNVIAGNGGDGVDVNGASRTAVQGNAIGTDPTGTQALGNAANGVAVAGDDNLIGGSVVGANVIHNNGAVGVAVTSGHHNAILTNSIFNNSRKGISVARGANDGVVPPVINAVTTTNGQTVIRGMIFGRPKVTYLLQFFGNTTVDPSGFGEGQTFLGQAAIETHHLGFIQFAVTSPVSLPAGRIVTATATDPASNTSEFSKGVKTTARTIKPAVVHHTTLAQAIALSFGNGAFVNGTGTTVSFPTLFGGFRGVVAPGVPSGTIAPGLDTIGGIGLPTPVVPAAGTKAHASTRK